MMTGQVAFGGKVYTVAVLSETPQNSRYRVTMNGHRPKNWKPGEVRIGVECVFVCLTCRTHPRHPCRHIEIVRQFVAVQPLETVP